MQKRLVEDSQTGAVRFVRCQFVDLAGLIRGRDISVPHLTATATSGVATVPMNYLLDINDTPTDSSMGAAAGDFWAVADQRSYVKIPYLPATGHMFSDIVDSSGAPWSRCARSRLRSISAAAGQRVGTINVGLEQEGYLLRPNGNSYLPSANGNLLTSDHLDAISGFLADLGESLSGLGSPVEKLMLEDGHGMVELTQGHGPPLEAVDQYVRFKQAFRYHAKQHGFVGTFMPKPFADASGAGLHVHLSIRDAVTGSDCLSDSHDKYGLSPLAYSFIAGLLRHAGSLVALGCASVNSYKRLLPGSWAPAHVSYGVGNRSTMIRVVQSSARAGGETTQRLELRTPDGTCNPYLLLSAAIAAGAQGVTDNLEPVAPIEIDLGSVADDQALAMGVARVPQSLDRALDALENDSAMATMLGPDLVSSYLRVKRSEWKSFANSITDWEKAHYPSIY